jgi:hypothetical protein
MKYILDVRANWEKMSRPMVCILSLSLSLILSLSFPSLVYLVTDVDLACVHKFWLRKKRTLFIAQLKPVFIGYLEYNAKVC